MSEASERDEVERLKASRRGFKAALTRSRWEVEQDIEDHPDGEDPTFLKQRIEVWSQRWIKFQEAEETVICHLEADATYVDKDVNHHLTSSI